MEAHLDDAAHDLVGLDLNILIEREGELVHAATNVKQQQRHLLIRAVGIPVKILNKYGRRALARSPDPTHICDCVSLLCILRVTAGQH